MILACDVLCNEPVIIVAPAEAQWPIRASGELVAAHLMITRLYEPTLLRMFLDGMAVHALLIDSRIAHETLKVIRRRSGDRMMRVLLVHDAGNAVTCGSLHSAPWPASIEAVRTWVGA